MTIAAEHSGGRVTRAWMRITSTLDRRHRWLLAALGVLYFAVTVMRARVTPFWHDEIYTLVLSRLPTVGDVWRAARSGADLTPPLNLFLTRAAEAMAGRGLALSRLPAMVGFCIMSLAIFYIVRARSSVVLAFAAILVPWYTRGYRYSSEARGYGVMMGLSGLLFWAWSEAARGHRRRLWLPIFAIVCAASIWNHYFAVVTFVPVAAGEVYRSVRRRAADWPLWTAAAVGLACCVPLAPLIRNAATQGTMYWRHAEWADVGATYSFLFRDLWSISPWFLAALAIVVLGGLARGRWTLPAPIAPGYEVVAGIVALAIPAIAVGLGALTGAFTPRYALTGVAGFSITVPLALWCLSRRSRAVEVVLIAVLIAGVAQPSIDLFEHPPAFHDPVGDRPLLVAELRGSPPVIVSGAVQFLQLWYYAPADLRRRLWYVADPARAVRYLGSDTADRGYIQLSHWAPIPVRTYQDLIDRRSFTLYDDGTGWLPSQLHDGGAVMNVAGTEERARISHVTLSNR
jgi:hypothetical protein